MSVWLIRAPWALLFCVFFTVSGCATTGTAKDNNAVGEASPAATPSVHLRELTQVLPELLSARAVVVGEQHDRLDHHVLQLDVIRYLHSVNPRLAIGLEFFDQTTQPVLDDYVAGRIDERDMLRGSDYFNNWRFDYRLYAPILRFAREREIPLIALNVPRVVSQQIAREGLAKLSEEQEQYVPDDLDRSVPGYAERIRESFAAHADTPIADVDRFIDAQLVWDEAMADSAARYLEQNPADQMVILAGIGHVIYGSGIPTRLERRIGPPVLTVIPLTGDQDGDTEMADYLVRTEPLSLPEKSVLGIQLNTDDDGLLIEEVIEDSAAARAGIMAGDRLRAVNGQTVDDFAELATLMWDKSAGDEVMLSVVRQESGAQKRLELRVVL